MKDTGLIFGKWFDAEVVSATPNNGVDLSEGVDIRLRMREVKRDINWPVKIGDSENDYHSLAVVARCLKCAVNGDPDNFDVQQLKNKRCCVKINSTLKEGKWGLDIVGFAFFLGSILHAEGGKLIGSVRL